MRGARKVRADVEALIRAAPRSAVDRGRRIDEPGTLLKEAVRGDARRVERRTGRGDQVALDGIGGEIGIRLKHQRDDTRRDRSSLRCAGHHEQRFARCHRTRIDIGEVALIPHRAHHVSARSHQVGLHEAFIRRARRGERGETVVGRQIRRVVVGHRAGGDDVGHIAGHTDRHRGRPAVAGRSDHHDAGLPCRHDGLIEGIVPIIRFRRGAERQVQNANLVLLLVRDDPIETRDDVCVRARALAVECTHDDQVRVRRDAERRADRRHGAAGCDRRDVGSVAVRIGRHGLRPAGDDVDAGQDARGKVLAAARPYARVEHRDGDSLAGDAAPLQERGAHQHRVVGDVLIGL